METVSRTIPEEVLVEIFAILPLRSVARFKSVCKQWKSVIESAYSRRRFVSLHENSSSSWSLMFVTEYLRPITEAIGFHGCERWDLPKSLGSYILPFQPYPNLSTFEYFYVASSNGLIWIEIFVTRTKNMPYKYKSFVGNPVLQEWVEIPPPPEPCTATSLVTRADEDGVVSSFKVVSTRKLMPRRHRERNVWRVYVYSSDTGLWTFKRLVFSCSVDYACSSPPVNLNGMFYLWERRLDPTEHGVLIAHDFYGPEDDDQCRVIPLPVPDYDLHNRRCLTTSRGDVFCIEMQYEKLKIWRLNNNSSESSEWWQLSREEINRAFVNCFPLAMNPFDSDIVYLWSQEYYCFVYGNLQTQEFIFHEESKKWSSTSSEGCWHMNIRDSIGDIPAADRNESSVVILSQFVLPQWMDSVPRPPS